jgi:aminopeptidase N
LNSRPSSLFISIVLASLFLASQALPLAAQPIEADPRVNAESGRQIAAWPPARHFDHLHQLIELDIPDIQQAYLIGRTRIDAVAIGSTRTSLRLDSKGPLVHRVTVDGSPATFTLEPGTLLITLPKPVAPGQRVSVLIDYMLDFSANRGLGLTFSGPVEGATSPTSQHPQIHAQGQAQHNSRWFPCHDAPNEKLTTEIICTVEEGYTVVSNGRLLSTTSVRPANPHSPARTRWHWSQEKPHSPYLVTIAVGKFARVELGGPESARPGLDMPAYGPIGSEGVMRSMLANTAQMIAFYEELFDVPYPWYAYAQVIVRDFAAGGMENTGCTLLHMGTLRGGPGSQDSLIAHEVAHQWIGNLITCNSWDHLWLNEGWASYAEALWFEHAAAPQGPGRATAAYQRTIRRFVQSQRMRSLAEYPQIPPLVSNRFIDGDTVFMKSEDPYARGAIILHMLRMRLGDDAFFRATSLFIKRHAYGTVTTDDFRRVLEETSGQNLRAFFNQWTMRPGMPRLAMDLDWNEETSTLSVLLEQTQRIDERNPAYTFDLPIVLRFEGHPSQTHVVSVIGATASATFSLPAKPSQVSVDPRLTVLAAVEVRKELAGLLEELTPDVPLAFEDSLHSGPLLILSGDAVASR